MVRGEGERGSTGVSLIHTNNVTLRNIEVQNFGDGIYMGNCNNSVLINNIVLGNKDEGINIDCPELMYGDFPEQGESHSNLFTGNVVSDNRIGIRNNGRSLALIGNTISNNSIYGIDIPGASTGSTIYHNNFINNTRQAVGGVGVRWDNGYPSGGNYWDSYAGKDSDADGIGDTPYLVDGRYDRYPLMIPWTDMPEPALLPILTLLGLISLPALLWRRSTSVIRRVRT